MCGQDPPESLEILDSSLFDFCKYLKVKNLIYYLIPQDTEVPEVNF